MTNPPTFGELLREEAISKADVTAAVDAFMLDHELRHFVVGDRYH